MTNLEKANAIAEEERRNRIEKYKERSRHALSTAIERRCRTIFIGNLDSIEQKFGYLWGFPKLPEQLKEKELLFFQLWKDLRKEILDKSNNQVKLLLRELQSFNVALKQTHYDIHILNREDS